MSPYWFGLDMGPILLMVENHGGCMLWQPMRGCRRIVDDLQRAGFEGSWLNLEEQRGSSLGNAFAAAAIMRRAFNP